MSRIKEALLFTSDEERLEWFQSLTPKEQEEIVKEATEFMETVKAALQPIIESWLEWFRKVQPIFVEIAASYAVTQANNACNRPAFGFGTDGESNESAGG